MRKIILFGLVIFSTIGHTSTFKDVTNIYNKLLKSSPGIRGTNISQLPIPIVSAVTTKSKEIQITSPLTSKMSKNELAYILAHELGHVNGIGTGRSNELQADLFAKQLLNRAGFKVCPGIKGLRYFIKEETESHPSYKTRIRNVGC